MSVAELTGQGQDNGVSASIDDVREYWNSHLNCTQFLGPVSAQVGSDEFYDTLQATLFDRYTYKKALLAEFARGHHGETLLEIGCGLGLELGYLGQHGFDVTGIDLAPAAAELAGRHLNRLKVTGRTLVQNVEMLEFPDHSFDAIYSSGVIQHTPNIYKAIKQMMRVLRPGGRMLIILYHRHSWFYLLHKLAGTNIEFSDRDAPIINTYSRADLRGLFSKLRDIRIDTEYYYPVPTNRKGVLASLFNRVLVPVTKRIPSTIMKQFGWHLVLTGIKPS